MSQALEARFVRRFTATATVEADLVVPADRFSITVLFGPSGCGKTTTLRCLAGLERPDEGRIAFAGQPWYDADEKVFLSPQRRGIGYLFQDYALFPHLSAMGNIAYGIADLPAAQRRQRTAEMLDLLGLTGLENRYPRQLSGGEQQRVALARVLVRRPRLLLLDEPLSALDGPTRERLRLELPRLLANFGVPVVLVTHDRIEATALAELLVVLDRGRVLQQGLAADVFARPTSPRVARVVGTETILPGRVIERTADIATVAVGPAVLSAVCSDAMAERVYVCIRAEAVALTVGVEEGMNRLSGRVTSVTLEGALVRVGLDCGFPLVARITWREWVRQGVGEGMPATAWVDPADVHLIALEGRGEWLRGEPKEEQPCERK